MLLMGWQPRATPLPASSGGRNSLAKSHRLKPRLEEGAEARRPRGSPRSSYAKYRPRGVPLKQRRSSSRDLS